MAQIDSKQLIEKYNSGELSVEEQEQLELLIESGEVSLDKLNLFTSTYNQLMAIQTPEHSARMDEGFYMQLSKEKRKTSAIDLSALQQWWQSVWQNQWQWAYSLVLVLIGGAVGYYWNQGSNQKIETIAIEMQQMKEMMMLAMLEKESTTERLRAVSLSTEMDTVSDKVAMALINTLRHDENNNVRMAAIDALALYTDDPGVREELVASIKFQESPLVQLALSELMVAMNEQKAKKEFDNLWESYDTPAEIQNQIKKKMSTMI